MTPLGASLEISGPPLAVTARLVERFGIHALVIAYVLLNLPLLASKPDTFDQVRVFSVDEYGICTSVRYLVQTASFSVRGTPATAGPGLEGQTCNPYPYGQLYNLLIAEPLILLGGGIQITEKMIIRAAVIVLVLSGFAALLLIYAVCTRLYSASYGLLAAVLLMLTPEFLRWSNEIHPDLLQLACLLAGFYFSVRVYETSSVSSRVVFTALAAIFAGAAMAAKLNGVFLLPVIVVAYNRAFFRSGHPLRIGRLLVYNIAQGSLMLALFAATFAAGNPCLVRHPDIAVAPFSRFGDNFVGNVATTTKSLSRLANLLPSCGVLARSTIGYGMFPICLVASFIAVLRLARRPGEELQSPRILAEVFLWVFLTYSLLFGYGLVDGRLRAGYERYVLPAVPFFYISAIRVGSIVGRWAKRIGPTAGIAAVALLLALQSHLLQAFVSEYKSFHLRKEQGFFKVHDWVRQHVPMGSTIYTEFYIYVPTDTYKIVRHYAVFSVDTMRASDYVITKTLDYEVYKNPERWAVYQDNMAVVQSQRLYELLERGQLPGFERVALLSAGDEFDRNDAVAVYRNLNRAPRTLP